jgi:hypothetical protein
MRKDYFFILILTFSIAPIFAQQNEFGGGAYHFEHGECITSEQRVVLQSQIKESINQLISDGVLSAEKSMTSVAYNWPIRQADGFNYNSVYGISNYVDHDPTPGIEDYNCSDRSYNGHRGTDIFLWPYEWHMVDNEQVEVIAAAPGTIVWKTDGNDSYNCVLTGGLTWNAIFVRHDDNSVSWYGHMKEGSLTSKGVGDDVDEGEFLGIVASSGYSTGPHLHFEVYDSNNELMDPYSGACNDLNEESLWQEQRPFREPTINTIMTHDVAPAFADCYPAIDNHISNCFEAGNTVYFAAYYHDQMAGMLSGFRVYRPDESTEWGWTHQSPDTYNASWWYFSRTLPNDAQVGTWRYEVMFEGTTITHEFYVGGASISTADDDFSFCAGESLVLSAPEGATYEWSTGSSDQSIEVNTGGNYGLTVTTSGGCVLETNQEVTEIDLPVINMIDGVISSTPFTPEVYAVEDNAGSSYEWTVMGGNLISGAGTASIEIEWLESTSVGQVCVQETNAAGCVSDSVCLDVEIQIDVSSVANITGIDAWTIFPNPVQERLVLDLDISQQIDGLQLKMHNAIGQLVFQQHAEKVLAGKWQKYLDLSDLPAGVYWLALQSGTQSVARKVIVL